jgi:hypothetical protein
LTISARSLRTSSVVGIWALSFGLILLRVDRAGR